MDSILDSVKKNLGLDPEFKEFDPDIIMAINTSLNVLMQLGVGSANGFCIEDNSKTWSDFIDDANLNMVKTYIFAKVKIIFDPPQISSVLECMKEIVREMECRINYQVDPPDAFENGGEEDEPDDGYRTCEHKRHRAFRN